MQTLLCHCSVGRNFAPLTSKKVMSKSKYCPPQEKAAGNIQLTFLQNQCVHMTITCKGYVWQWLSESFSYSNCHHKGACLAPRLLLFNTVIFPPFQIGLHFLRLYLPTPTDSDLSFSLPSWVVFPTNCAVHVYVCNFASDVSPHRVQFCAGRIWTLPQGNCCTACNTANKINVYTCQFRNPPSFPCEMIG